MLTAMQDGALLVGIVSAAALVVSLLFLARQTRESTRQSVLANQLAGIQAKGEIYSAVDRILYRLAEHPELRQYFYDGVPVPVDHGGTELARVRAQVFAIAELYADAIERGLDTYRSVEPAADFRTPMDVYARDVVEASPALRELIAAHPFWWPNLEAWLAERNAR